MVLESLLKKIKDENLAIHVVWTPVLSTDDRKAAEEARSLIPDARAVHYWDADQSLGLAYGRAIELPRGRELAWDIYFAYAAGVVWGETLPPPDAWAHQLGEDARRLGDGSAFRRSVEGLLTAHESKERKNAAVDGR